VSDDTDTANPPRRGPRVEVHIERVVLHGLDLNRSDAQQVRAAMAAAIAEALGGRPASEYDSSADARRRTTVHLAGGAPPAATGNALGRAVAATLTPAPRRGRS
jgi:hypothetical protein